MSAIRTSATASCVSASAAKMQLLLEGVSFATAQNEMAMKRAFRDWAHDDLASAVKKQA